MAAPAPGFPPELETAIAQAVAGHRYYTTIMECSCTDEVENAPSLDWEDWEEHLAAVVMETIAQHTTTEWGVRFDAGLVHDGLTEEEAREWTADGRGGPALSRRVLPWQEVKA